MSFRLQPTPVARPNRCQLFGPGSRVALFEKMAASAADVINLDLEDSVAPSDKDSARENIIKRPMTLIGAARPSRYELTVSTPPIGTATLWIFWSAPQTGLIKS